MELVTDPTQVLGNIARLQSEFASSPELMDRASFVHAWYVDTRDPTHPKFGFSKFLGYQDLDSKTYLAQYKDLNGRDTEKVLKDWFEELRAGTPEFNRYHEMLKAWLARHGKTPRGTVRLMVLKPELLDHSPIEDRQLLDLIKAVADLLPAHQRHELRAYL